MGQFGYSTCLHSHACIVKWEPAGFEACAIACLLDCTERHVFWGHESPLEPFEGKLVSCDSCFQGYILHTLMSMTANTEIKMLFCVSATSYMIIIRGAGLGGSVQITQNQGKIWHSLINCTVVACHKCDCIVDVKFNEAFVCTCMHMPFKNVLFVGVLCKPLNLACTLSLVWAHQAEQKNNPIWNQFLFAIYKVLKIPFHFILSVCNVAEEVCNVREEGISNTLPGTFNTDMQYLCFRHL